MRWAVAVVLAVACSESAGTGRGTGTGTSEWTVELAEEGVVTWVEGPEVHGSIVRVGSSAIGIVEVDVDTGRVVGKDAAAGPRGRDAIDVVARGDGIVVRRDGVVREGVWRAEMEVDVGAAGPVRVEDVVAVVVDDELIGLSRETGERVWTAEGRYAYVPGALDGLGASPSRPPPSPPPEFGGRDQGRGGRADLGSVRAVALDGGIGPAVVTAATGKRVSRGETIEGAQVVAADWGEDGSLVAAVRGDVIVAWDGKGRVRWRWALPGGARVDPIGLQVARGAVFVFHDGRTLVRRAL